MMETFPVIDVPETASPSVSRLELIDHPLLSSTLLKKRWLVHPVFWGLYVVFFALTGGDLFITALQYELLLLPVKMVVVYLTIYWLIPVLFLRGRYWSFFLGFFVLLLGGAVLQRLIIFYVLYPLIYPSELYGELFTTYWIVKNALSIFTITVLGSSIKITKYWYEDHRRSKALKEEKLEAELKFLKAQMHPHFLFNTLNNLYSLTLNKSDRAPEVVLRLSGLMNYMLFEANAGKVGLALEIETIHNYIALERIRYGQSLDLFFEVTGKVEEVEIAPMLLLPFVENSFKHGVSDEVEEKWISANLSVKGEVLQFKVENSRSPRPDDARPLAYTGGIGLKNVQRRLELIYPDRHELKIFEEEDSYLITLKINLNPV
ncbi:MAG: histidine kinase [Bacteroidia bacterium]|nr:histidine kinase [Bacteroidia bacterium]